MSAMNLKAVEDFFGSKLEEEFGSANSSTIQSLSIETKGVFIYFSVIRDHAAVVIKVDTDTPDQAFPLCEYNVSCDSFILTEAHNVGPVLMFSHNGHKNMNISITKTSEGFSLSVGV